MLKELNSLEANKSHSVPVVTHDSSHQKEASTVVFGGNNPTVETNTVKRILLKMKKDGDYVQNLPYLYRCPSI
jgi:CTP:molybdopterin cytidylyltransferase MocA